MLRDGGDSLWNRGHLFHFSVTPGDSTAQPARLLPLAERIRAAHGRHAPERILAEELPDQKHLWGHHVRGLDYGGVVPGHRTVPQTPFPRSIRGSPALRDGRVCTVDAARIGAIGLR